MRKTKSTVPATMKVQFSRLFGAQSRIARREARSDAEWRRDLRLVLSELWNYVDANIDTDIVHRHLIDSGFDSADLSLSNENFWPGYVEGLTRILLCLLGDYPDKRKRKSGAKDTAYYKLKNDRSLAFTQNKDQRLHLLCWTATAVLELRGRPLESTDQFRQELGFDVPIQEFVQWYKQKYPDDYLKIF